LIKVDVAAHVDASNANLRDLWRILCSGHRLGRGGRSFDGFNRFVGWRTWHLRSGRRVMRDSEQLLHLALEFRDAPVLRGDTLLQRRDFSRLVFLRGATPDGPANNEPEA